MMIHWISFLYQLSVFNALWQVTPPYFLLSTVHVQHDTNKTTFCFLSKSTDSRIKCCRFLPLKACFHHPSLCSVDFGLDFLPELWQVKSSSSLKTVTNRCLFAKYRWGQTDALCAVDGLVYHRGFAVKETPKSGGFLKFVPVFFFFWLLCFFQGCDFILCCIIFFSHFTKRIINIWIVISMEACFLREIKNKGNFSSYNSGFFFLNCEI